MSPESIVDNAVKSDCSSIAYTYTEPTIFMELAADTGRLAKEKGLANVFVSNGFMTQEAIDFAGEWLDGINVDLKAFSKEYYRDLCKGKLQPVLDNISYIAQHTNIWIEVTTLVVPGANDSEEELRSIAEFIVKEAGEEVPWHISRFHPQYKHQDGGSTPMSKIEQAYEIGKEAGLRYVYPGNVPGMKAESTFCYSCGRVLIERSGYRILQNYIENSCCPDCGSKIDGFGI
jgi:pyruvate formate lyase activating enzyme